MKILILAAGYGTRLQAIAKDMPKPLLPINGKPMLNLILDELSQIDDVSEYVVVTNDKFYEQFQKWQQAQGNLKSRIRIINDGTKSNDDRLGSVGDMRFVWEREKELDDWLVVGGDNLFDFDLSAFKTMAKAKAPAVTVGVYDIKDISQAHMFGILSLDGSGKVTSFEEKPAKPKSTLVTMCFYYFPKETIGFIQQYLKESSSSDAAGGYIKWLSEKKEVYGFQFQGTWYDIGSVESYYEAQKKVQTINIAPAPASARWQAGERWGVVKGRYLFTSESVGNGHPDKVCDQISDAVLDSVLKNDPKGRVACETFCTMGLVIVGGEITTTTYVDVHKLVRDVLLEIGYNHPKYGFDANTCSILNAINKQSPDISQGVDTGGAGDQGIMFGYACDETPSLMPLPIMLAHRLVERVEEVRKKNILSYLGPDCKSQVTIEYEDDKPLRIDAVVLACQHTEEILDKTGKQITEKSKKEIIQTIAHPIVGKMIDKKTKFYVNETGKFVVGGPQSDTGVTGRKIIVDTYGGVVPHGGGAFSGKDPTKVDRSAAYMSRYITKNIVAAGLAKKCLLQVGYAIGFPQPVSVMVDTFGTGKVTEQRLVELVRKHFDLSPRGIIETLDLRKPVYLKTASYGHFGRPGFAWEKTDRAKVLKRDA